MGAARIAEKSIKIVTFLMEKLVQFFCVKISRIFTEFFFRMRQTISTVFQKSNRQLTMVD